MPRPYANLPSLRGAPALRGSDPIYQPVGPDPWTRDNTEINVWSERDRNHVELTTLDGETIVEWWDEDALQAVEDGYLDPRDLHGSAVEYANDMGMRTSKGRDRAGVGLAVHRAQRGRLKRRQRSPRAGRIPGPRPPRGRSTEALIRQVAEGADPKQLLESMDSAFGDTEPWRDLGTFMSELGESNLDEDEQELVDWVRKWLGRGDVFALFNDSGPDFGIEKIRDEGVGAGSPGGTYAQMKCKGYQVAATDGSFRVLLLDGNNGWNTFWMCFTDNPEALEAWIGGGL